MGEYPGCRLLLLHLHRDLRNESTLHPRDLDITKSAQAPSGGMVLEPLVKLDRYLPTVDYPMPNFRVQRSLQATVLHRVHSFIAFGLVSLSTTSTNRA